MTSRRGFMGKGISAAMAGGLCGSIGAAAGRAAQVPDSLAERLQAGIAGLPVDDAHCHPLGDREARTTVDGFLGRIALSAPALPACFPEGIYDQFEAGDAATRARLDQRYGVSRKRNVVLRHFETSLFVKYLVKEMAGFLGCRPTLGEVIEARNARGGDYFGYMSALFRDARIANVMIDTGHADGLDAAGIQRFEMAIRPTRVHYIVRVETLTSELFELDVPYPELRDRFVARVRDALDGTGNYGKRSVGMKSYLLPDIGLIRPSHDDAAAAASWDEVRRSRGAEPTDGAGEVPRGKLLRERLLTIALEECLERDMPMQFHAGAGAASSVELRNQHPYYLEEVARFDKDGVMRMPKIIPIHGGYPLVGEAAWLSHLYANVYCEVSCMTPLIHFGLLHRYLQIMEAVPLSKILFGSDAYGVPELYWLAARWGKRYLAKALAVYVAEGICDEEEALQAARRILHLNTRRVYGLDEVS